MNVSFVSDIRNMRHAYKVVFLTITSAIALELKNGYKYNLRRFVVVYNIVVVVGCGDIGRMVAVFLDVII